MRLSTNKREAIKRDYFSSEWVTVSVEREKTTRNLLPSDRWNLGRNRHCQLPFAILVFITVTQQMPPILGVTKTLVTWRNVAVKMQKKKSTHPPTSLPSVHFGWMEWNRIQPTNRPEHTKHARSFPFIYIGAIFGYRAPTVSTSRGMDVRYTRRATDDDDARASV